MGQNRLSRAPGSLRWAVRWFGRASSLSVLEFGSAGLSIVPAAFWNFEGHAPRRDEDEESWLCRATTYGPSSSRTRLLPRDRLIFLRWGTSPGTRYRGQGPTSWASLTAKTQAEAERSLGDEAGGPIAQLIAIPQDGGDDDDENDPLAPLKAGIKAARGKAEFVETTSAGWGQGRTQAPGNGNRDWQANRLGPHPPQAFVELADQSFTRMLAACGVPPGLFESKADGTSQREALRRWHLGTVEPLAAILADELTKRLEVEVQTDVRQLPQGPGGPGGDVPETCRGRRGRERGADDFRVAGGRRRMRRGRRNARMLRDMKRDLAAADAERRERGYTNGKRQKKHVLRGVRTR